ncbi:Holliday junction ATP-dependent DNA helicase RuvA [Lactococcus hodotermopsidis]|uniref:Holliday junction branch migration complex subunit RuvA n=1 Tax=Pseudolactococcus hodotermopsidis TaxID=2709157 RepID=A0A6A0B858_9LACT|nr:Holliday junction branch migration protein RuvA [Lactococcus hodotermopsidis]GFH41540.1 Holliday junction ATP-dependent DNA helicase RuvA [Lactococcus hodotermopsidis]
MYEYLTGKLTKITPTYVVLEVSGVGYIINVANPYVFSDMRNQLLKIYVHQVIREDAHTLYGFKTFDEKTLFLKIVSVKGIGPKSALAIIAADDNDGLVAAINNSDIKYLTKFPGVGKKTAMQMALDLEGKFDSQMLATVAKTTATTDKALSESLEALEALGYKATELKKIEKKMAGQADTAQAYIKLALKMLMK